MFGVQLYRNNARALLSRISSILNLDWLQHVRSVRGVYEVQIHNPKTAHKSDSLLIVLASVAHHFRETYIHLKIILPIFLFRGRCVKTSKYCHYQICISLINTIKQQNGCKDVYLNFNFRFGKSLPQ